jgi:hypothetical protein
MTKEILCGFCIGVDAVAGWLIGIRGYSHENPIG